MSARPTWQPTLTGQAGALALLAASAIALAVAPLALDSSYSWLENTTSEAGAQGVDGAWVARLGFLLFGAGVLATACLSKGRWRQPAILLHMIFAACMFSVAAFSTRPWIAGTDFDTTEDFLHSVFASVMGFAFALGVVAIMVRSRKGRALDATAVIASVVLPAGMTAFSSYDGLLQRLMFVVAYCWYARELLLSPSPQA